MEVSVTLARDQGKTIIAAIEKRLPHCRKASWFEIDDQAKPPFAKLPSDGISFVERQIIHPSHNTIMPREKTTRAAKKSALGSSNSRIFFLP
jgi:hypothetical protein